ncbi:hypothetical protein Bhyg_06022 [Pseudolycoriella hygida]|uniref:Uncharacterized protein n=1 Tax=Pseudolycoriella hygida TaxID=35572 RepID=A0A9Q0N139_9DIPT|nr:hypothetical protein Bhyg_06022 [Pseudolycoriella hygida]
MEVMEEGNLMDRVPVLLQRDMQYYQEHQSVLQETLCPGVVGGKLDFPRYASFAAVKIVHWWEDEYYAAYKKNSGLLNLDEIGDDGDEGNNSLNLNAKVIVKSSDPERFVGSVTKSADKLLDHIHTLSQEALDHADLTVLTATIGASALIKNALWVYLQSVTKSICPPKGDENGGSLKLSYKQYSEMTEALAERLLDLHCRLLSLYIIQDADCLNWECNQPFFESERGSYTIQMWNVYLQGTKHNLWNSVPPNMAQRVYAGMLNETLSLLTVRYTQTVPSQSRSQLLLVDVCNLLLCVSEILPSICENGEQYVGLNLNSQSKIIRDVHAKCQELFCCLLLRGISLGNLYKIMRKGPSSVNMFNSGHGLPSPWITFSLPKLFPPNQNGQWATKCSDFASNTAIALELKVLLNSPQANWAHLLKILLMRDSLVSSIIHHHLMRNIPTSDCFYPSLDQPFMNQKKFSSKCEGFLCGKECNKIADWISGEIDPVGQTNYQVVLALTYIIVLTGKSSDISNTIVSSLDKSQIKDWQFALDRRQVWNQKRPPWLEAILHLIYPVLDPVIHMLIVAVQTGATMYQAMSLAISCLTEMWDCIPDSLYTVSVALADVISTEIRPLGESVLIQILFSALYTKLLEASKTETIDSDGVPSSPQVQEQKSSICNVLAEAICSIDEDNKHTESITALINYARESQRSRGDLDDVAEGAGLSFVSTVKMDDLHGGHQSTPSTRSGEEYNVENADYISEMLVSDILTSSIGKQSLKLLYNYLRKNSEWLFQKLNVSDIELSEFKLLPGQNITEEEDNLLNLMFHIGHQPFDQLLTGGIKIDYNHWFQTPMSITTERAWLQISQRYEFQENVKLSVQETVMVAFITSQCKS